MPGLVLQSDTEINTVPLRFVWCPQPHLQSSTGWEQDFATWSEWSYVGFPTFRHAKSKLSLIASGSDA